MMRPATIFRGQGGRGDGRARGGGGSGGKPARASAFFFEKIGDGIVNLHKICYH